MKLIQAKEIIRKLRSNGVKVFLKNGAVTFTGLLENTTPAVREEIFQHGNEIKQIVIGETKEGPPTDRRKLKKRDRSRIKRVLSTTPPDNQL